MKIPVTLFLAVALAASAGAGCGKKKDRDSKTQSQPLDAREPVTEPGTSAEPALPDPEALVAYMKATIAAVDAAGGDCARLVDPVVSLARDNADLIAEMAATSDTLAAKQWKSDNIVLFQEFQARLGVVAGCARSDPHLVDVLKRLSPNPAQKVP